MTKKCALCNKQIIGREKKAIYCSTNCSNKNYRSKNKERDRIYQKQYQREARKKSKLLERPTPERGKHKMPKEPADFSKFDDLYDELGMGNVKKD